MAIRRKKIPIVGPICLCLSNVKNTSVGFRHVTEDRNHGSRLRMVCYSWSEKNWQLPDRTLRWAPIISLIKYPWSSLITMLSPKRFAFAIFVYSASWLVTSLLASNSGWPRFVHASLRPWPTVTEMRNTNVIPCAKTGVANINEYSALEYIFSVSYEAQYWTWYDVLFVSMAIWTFYCWSLGAWRVLAWQIVVHGQSVRK